MKQVIVKDYGGTDQLNLQDNLIPKPKQNELIVKLKAASVNPIESKVRSGAMKQMMPATFPYTPGSDGAGVVVEAGSDVTQFKAGDEVFGSFEAGSLAEYAVVSEGASIVMKPAGVSFEIAAALPMVGTTAMDIIETGNFAPGQSVLVIGATGGIGTLLVQLLLNKKVNVIATARQGTREHLKQLGVEHIIDYTRTEPVENIKKYFDEGVDAVIDLVNVGEKLFKSADAVRSGGQLISVLFGPDPSAFPQKEVTVKYVRDRNIREWLTSLAEMIEKGKLVVHVDEVFALDDVQKAYDKLEKNHPFGKIVVAID